jgi:mannose-6-phosphate isomerase-like protein (cupin superfamily)
VTDRYHITRIADLPGIECSCGETRRAFVEESAGVASMHLVDISSDSHTHYHRRMTEIYYILAGQGEMELDGRRHPVAVGDAIFIKPGCRHRAIGKMKVLNVAVPAFDPTDEYFDS